MVPSTSTRLASQHQHNSSGFSRREPGTHEQQQQQQQQHAPPEAAAASSRLCVKNIPKHLTDERLKQHFSAKGQVTDVKILKTRDGKPRQMAFVGYRSVEDAAAALKYYQHTFIDTSRISIEYARRYVAPDAARAAASEPAKQQQQQVGGKHQLAAADGPAGEAPAAKKARRSSKQGGDAVVDAAAEADPKLAEFLQLMQPRAKAALWGNDDLLPAGAAAGAAGAATVDSKRHRAAEAAGGSVGTGRASKPAAAAAASSSDDDDSNDGSGSSSDDGDDSSDGSDLLASKDAVVLDEGVSDLDYLRSRMSKKAAAGSSDDGDDASSSSDDDDDDAGSDGGADTGSGEGGAAALEQQQHAGSSASEGSEEGADAVDADDEQLLQSAAGDAEAAVRESGRLFVRNLAYSAGQEELAELFGAFGQVEETHLVLDRETRRSRGIAYVKYLLPEDAVAALRGLDMTPFQGRLLHVLPAKRRPDEDAEEQQQQAAAAGGKGPAGFKADREAQRKRDAGNRAAWSTLFMRSDTVAAAVAAHYGISKGQLLDASASDLPLRMALGEAQVIAQTKAALTDAGANAIALESAAAASGAAAAHTSVQRSATTLLVKNLPYSADADELQALFAGSGRSVVRLVLPSTRTLALVEFGEQQDARAAFKALAYKKYQQAPLYLEWAPKDIWDTPAAPAAAAAAGAGAAGPDAAHTTQPTAAEPRQRPAAAAAAGAGQQQQGDEEEDGQQAPVVSIYVKNLNFATSDAALAAHFKKAVAAAGGQIHSAKVARRKGADGKLLSMGFGFVEVDSEAAAKAAIQQLQGSMLEKHKVQLQLAKRAAAGGGSGGGTQQGSRGGRDGSNSSSSRGTKLVVRNVAFEATRKDLMGLFGPWGHIKSCRLPKKFDGSHRGFAFLEFTTKQEAANALQGVGGTHLYGRRLVVEYAQAEDGADGDGGAVGAGGAGDSLEHVRAKTAAKFAAAADAADEHEGGLDGRAQGARKRMRRNL